MFICVVNVHSQAIIIEDGREGGTDCLHTALFISDLPVIDLTGEAAAVDGLSLLNCQLLAYANLLASLVCLTLSGWTASLLLVSVLLLLVLPVFPSLISFCLVLLVFLCASIFTV